MHHPLSCSVSHKLDVGSASKHYSVWAAFGGTASDLDWPTDPRLPTLGSRGESMCLLPEHQSPALSSHSAHQTFPAMHSLRSPAAILPRGSAPKATTSAVDYARWRIKQVCQFLLLDWVRTLGSCAARCGWHNESSCTLTLCVSCRAWQRAMARCPAARACPWSSTW